MGKAPQACPRMSLPSLGPASSIAWSERIDLCGDALYMKITGMTPEEMFPNWLGDADA